MTFLPRPIRPQRIAIVGGGISGLASAYLLSPHHAVTLFEAEPRLGGHARTVLAGRDGTQPVDTGFIVFNYANYPHLTRMFLDLDVPVVRSDMSFGASIDNGRIEYGLKDLKALTAQKSNLLRPGFLRMIRDILRFNAKAEGLAEDDSLTIGELMDEMRLGDWFQRFYLTPLSGAIWSTSPNEIRKFPATALLQFFRNHALLDTSGQHQWWTVKGGSREYVTRIEAYLKARGVAIHKGRPVHSVQRNDAGVSVIAKDLPAQEFDQIIFASHSDQALRMIEKPTLKERDLLSAMRFQDNHMFLHRDTAQMPQRRATWASWVYKADTQKPEPSIGVSYWMNRLQSIDEADPLFVTLNPSDPIREELIYDQKAFRHPVFDRDALRAQRGLKDIQGQNRTWFAGAYTRHGFHEDGFASAVRIARQMEAELV